MILSESLWPGMTRMGFGVGSYVRIKPEDRNKFPKTQNDLWLPLASLAIREFEIAKERVPRELAHTLASAAFERIECDRVTGCWLSSSTSIKGDEEHTDALWRIAKLDMGGEPLNPIEDKDALRVCDNPDCLNPRHRDFTHRVDYRNTLATIDYSMFRTLEDGSIMCAWEEGTGQVLPSFEGSEGIFRALQRRCVPYVDDPSLAPLTASGMSKITIDAITGCMPVRSYYTRPEDFERKFMADTYGRIGIGPALRREGVPLYQRPAHIITFLAAGGRLKKGMQLNHECGFRPCANPGHITQMSREANIQHMYRMKAARARRAQQLLSNAGD